jgi:hypothetical protein
MIESFQEVKLTMPDGELQIFPQESQDHDNAHKDSTSFLRVVLFELATRSY